MTTIFNESFSPQEKEFGNFLLRNAGGIEENAAEALTRIGASLFRAWSHGVYSVKLADTDASLLLKCKKVVSRAGEHRITLLVVDDENNIAIYRYFELENFIGKTLGEQKKLQLVAVDFCATESIIAKLLDQLPDQNATVVMPDNRNADFLLDKFPAVEIRRYSEVKRSWSGLPAGSNNAMLITDCEQLTPEILAYFLKQHVNGTPLILCGDPDNSVIPGGTHRYYASIFNTGSASCVNWKKPNPRLDEAQKTTKSDKIEFAPYSSLKSALKAAAQPEQQLVIFPHQTGPLSAEAIAKNLFPKNEEKQQLFIASSMTWRQLKKSDDKEIKIILPRRDYDFLDFDRIQLLLNPAREVVQVYGDTELWQLALNRVIPVFSRTADICKKIQQELY